MHFNVIWDLLCIFIFTTICYYHYYLKKWHQRFSESQSYNQLQKYLRHCTVFWHKWPVHDLVLVIPLHPLSLVASNTRPCSKLGGTTLNGREEGGQYYISHTCDQERFEVRTVVFRGIVSTFLQLVVENPPHKQWLVICSSKGLLYLLTCGINRRLPYSKRILLQLRCYRLCRPNFDYGKLKIINTDLISPLFY